MHAYKKNTLVFLKEILPKVKKVIWVKIKIYAIEVCFLLLFLIVFGSLILLLILLSSIV